VEDLHAAVEVFSSFTRRSGECREWSSFVGSRSSLGA
jgi:hypothetical protein